MTAHSETAKYRHLTEKYCAGAGLDVASQGDPVVPWAWQLDLPPTEFAHYCSNHPAKGPIQLRGYADRLPVDDGSLDFLYSSHLLEDYPDWLPVLREWVRVVKPGGYIVVLLPDRDRWAAACAAGQPPNDAHRHECQGPEELASYAPAIGCELIECRFTDCFPGDYTVMGVFKKPQP